MNDGPIFGESDAEEHLIQPPKRLKRCLGSTRRILLVADESLDLPEHSRETLENRVGHLPRMLGMPLLGVAVVTWSVTTGDTTISEQL